MGWKRILIGIFQLAIDNNVDVHKLQIYPKFNILRSRFLEYWYKYFLARQVLHVDNRVTTAGEMEHSRNSAKALEALEGCTYFNDSHLNSFNPINPSFESCQVSCQHPQPTTHHFIFEDTLETPLIVSTAFGTTKKIFIIFMSCCVERRNFWGNSVAHRVNACKIWWFLIINSDIRSV